MREVAPGPARDDDRYFVGLDIGNNSTSIAYCAAGQDPESIDLSGGYGKPSIPTAVQYVAETGEWVIGEYAVQNQAAGPVVTGLLARAGRGEHVELGGRLMSLAAVFGVFIREALASVRSINPKAEIAGIVSTVPAYFGEAQKRELRQAFEHAGYGGLLAGLASDREAALHEYLLGRPAADETVMLLDFGSRELRGGVYRLSHGGGLARAECAAFYFDEAISTERLDAGAMRLFESFLDPRRRDGYRAELAAFHHQHKDMLFQKKIRERPLKLYLNFAYPPVECAVTRGMADGLTRPFERALRAFLAEVERKAGPAAGEVSAVLCAGGGFDMLWAREAVLAAYGRDKCRFTRNPKLAAALGAAAMCAGLAGHGGTRLELVDRQKLACDFGVHDGESFHCLAAKGSFWWQGHPARLFTVRRAVGGPLRLALARRSPAAEGPDSRESPETLEILMEAELMGLPERPKGATRLELGISFKSSDELLLWARDAGFGELFPASGWRAEFARALAGGPTE